MYDLDKRLKQLEEKIKQESFRKNKGLGNEVGYYIFDYPAENELSIRERVNYLVSKYKNLDYGFEIVVYDLYDMIIDLLIKEGFFEICEEYSKLTPEDIKIIDIITLKLIQINRLEMACY